MQANQQEFFNQVANLKKLIQIHRKNSRYEVDDLKPYIKLSKEAFRQYPKSDLVDQNVKIMWQLLEYNYFAPITQNELKCLNYVQGNFKEFRSDKQENKKRQKFDQDIQSVFQEDYIAENINSKKAYSWVNYMYSVWKKCDQEKFASVETRKSIPNKTLPNIKTSFSLTTDNRLTGVTQPKARQNFKLNKAEWKQVVEQNRNILSKIRGAIIKDLSWHLLHFEDNIQATKQIVERPFIHISSINQQLAYLRYQIPLLQKRQVADSMLKLVKIHKGKELVTFFQVQFQKGLNLPNKKFTEEEFHELNKQRECSLWKPYLTGSKSKYNFITHNLYGFQTIHKRQKSLKNIPSNIIWSNIKESKDVDKNSEVSKLFNSFQMCHQCRYLYEPHLLTKCGFNSTIKPKNHSIKVFNPYVEQITRTQSFNLQQKFRFYYQNNLLNEFERYSFQNHKYCCNRYFCKSCLKSYKFTKNISFCPYCQGLCHCTRCTRRDNIFYLKSIFLHLGGDLEELQHNQHYKELFLNSTVKQEKSEDSNGVMDIVRVADELEQIQSLTILLKKRQLIKYKVIKVKRNIFIKGVLLQNINEQTSPLIIL